MVNDPPENNTNIGLQQLLRDAEEGCFQLIVVTTVDRFSRDAGEMLSAIENLERSGVAVVSIFDEAMMHPLCGRHRSKGSDSRDSTAG